MGSSARPAALLGNAARAPRPRRMPTCTPSGLLSAIVRLRYRRLTAWRIAQCLQMAVSTVTRWLRRFGLGWLSVLEPAAPANRHERDEPGQLLHMDTKKLGRIGRPGHRIHGDRSVRTRGAGWEFLHVVVDDRTRMAYVEVLGTENQHESTEFPASSGRLVPQATDPNARADDGQRLGLVHTALCPAHQRQGGAPYSDSHPRLGLWTVLRQLRRAYRRPIQLAAPVPSSSTPSRDRSQATDRSTQGRLPTPSLASTASSHRSTTSRRGR